MTNEMKLLRAFIEASGYEVEEKIVGRDESLLRCLPIGSISGYKVTKKQSPVQDRIDAAREVERYQVMSGRSL